MNHSTRPASLRRFGRSRNRNLDFVGKSNLFNHKTAEDEIDEGSAIGGPSTGAITGKPKVDDTQNDSTPQPHDSQSAVIGINHKHKHKHTHKHETEPTEEEDNNFFDGFEITEQTKPSGFFNGFGITKETSAPGFFDGFQVDNEVPSGSSSANENIEYTVEPYQNEQGTFKNLGQIQNTPIPYKPILLCIGLSIACIVLFLCYWRNSFTIRKKVKTKKQISKMKKKHLQAQQNAERRKQAKMNHLKKLYEDYEKHKAEISVDPIQGENVLSDTYSPKRLVAIHMGENEDHKIEKIDFIEDIEFGQELSQSHSEEDYPALTMRMVKRNASTQEHWIQYSSYSSDDTTESDTSNSDDH